jgi:H/ACA ribonucleoprotein complex non-core subunit NAF1
MHDQDLVDDIILKGNAYDEHGPYDLDFSAGPSRPPPIPYDDPYADEYPPESRSSGLINRSIPNRSEYQTSIHGNRPDHKNDRGHSYVRGRGRGRDREHDKRGKGRQKWVDTTRGPHQNSSASGTSWDGRPIAMSQSSVSYDPLIARPLSPTSLAIAHVTGQLPDGSNISMPHIHSTVEAWSYQDPRLHQGAPFHFNQQGFPPPFVQPHINPRFASAFGLHMNMNMGSMQPQQYDPYEGSNMHSVSSLQTSDWADEWAVPTGPDEKVDKDTT